MGLCIGGKTVKGIYFNGVKLKGAYYNGVKIFTGSDVNIYGIKRQLSATATAWTRTDDAVGFTAKATQNGGTVVNDFDNLYPWSDFKSCNIDPATGNVKCYIGESTFKFDGSNGIVMTEIPEFWWKRWQADGWEYIQIADKSVEGFTKSEKFYVARYPISTYNSANAYFSASGQTPRTSVGLSTLRNNINTYLNKNNGYSWSVMDWHWCLIQMLYLVEYADYNTYNTLGHGAFTGSSVITSGSCDDLGMKSGSMSNDNQHSVIYRGIEDIHANTYEFIDGIFAYGTQICVCYNPQYYSSSPTSTYYTKLSYQMPSTYEGYIQEVGYDPSNPMVQFPTVLGGSTSKYITDYYYGGSTSTTTRHWYTSGCYWDGGNAGLWYTNVAASSGGSNPQTGARLIKA